MVEGKGTRHGEEVGRMDQEVRVRMVRSEEGSLEAAEDGEEPCLD